MTITQDATTYWKRAQTTTYQILMNRSGAKYLFQLYIVAVTNLLIVSHFYSQCLVLKTSSYILSPRFLSSDFAKL